MGIKRTTGTSVTKTVSQTDTTRTSEGQPVNDESAAIALAATTASTATSLAATTAAAAVALERRIGSIENQLLTQAKIADLKGETVALLATTRHETLLSRLVAIDEKQEIANGRTSKNEVMIAEFGTWRTKIQTYIGLFVFFGPVFGGAIAGVSVWGLNHLFS